MPNLDVDVVFREAEPERGDPSHGGRVEGGRRVRLRTLGDVEEDRRRDLRREDDGGVKDVGQQREHDLRLESPRLLLTKLELRRTLDERCGCRRHFDGELELEQQVLRGRDVLARDVQLVFTSASNSRHLEARPRQDPSETLGRCRRHSLDDRGVCAARQEADGDPRPRPAVQ